MAWDQVKVASVGEAVRAQLATDDADMHKQATLATNDYFRTEIRSNGIRRNITPPTQVTKDMFDPSETSDFPIIYAEVAPKSSGAYMVSFETGPRNENIYGGKIRIELNRIMTKKYSIDKIRLDAYKMPLLEILEDLLLKDIMDVEDNQTIGLDKQLCGDLNVVNPYMGCCRYVTTGAMSREALVHLKKGLPVAPGHLMTKKFLMNDLTYFDLGALDRVEVGGDMAQDMFVNGVTMSTIQGIDTVVTIKTDLIPNKEVFIYTDPKYYGGFYVYKDVAMVVDEVDDIWMTFFAHECVGASVANSAGVARASMTGTLVEWEDGIGEQSVVG